MKSIRRNVRKCFVKELRTSKYDDCHLVLRVFLKELIEEEGEINKSCILFFSNQQLRNVSLKIIYSVVCFIQKFVSLSNFYIVCKMVVEEKLFSWPFLADAPVTHGLLRPNHANKCIIRGADAKNEQKETRSRPPPRRAVIKIYQSGADGPRRGPLCK